MMTKSVLAILLLLPLNAHSHGNHEPILDDSLHSLRHERLADETKDVRDNLCTSFGFTKGTTDHSNCLMKLYIDEQNLGGSSINSGQRSSRELAMQEATRRELDRIRRVQQGLMLMELGTGIATGSLGASAPKKQSHTYTINGQIINCTTTGSVTNCF